ncbi:hypothetical protein [Streptomyces rhizosphaerihabitans]|uniref:hypothetical protein n=1 Tax=Streptomyces rhizosphaerihabitans TaxID=1266770 RepID=UPI0021BF5A4C|nr:hypothetical protein [Streptomyces rhizosphaerihabitans]MCT9010795.1 hypothetical protein [Streptomyces rhizosphaerihabitans]
MLTGLPDLGRPVPSVPGAAFRAFGDEGSLVLVPDALGLERQADGTAALLVTLLRGTGVPGGMSGRLEVGFAIDLPLEAAGRALVAQALPAALVPAELDGGVLEVTAQLGTGATTPLAPPVVLSPDMLARAHVVVDLTAESAVLATRLIEDSALPVQAVIRLMFPAVAPRLPLALEFDRRRLAQLLAERFGAQAVVPEKALGEALDALLADPCVTVVGDPAALADTQRAGTLALRLKGELTVPEESAAIAYRLRPVSGLSPEPGQVDLSEPARVQADRLLTVDPFAAARVLSGGGLDRFVRSVDVPALPTGQLKVTFVANLPEPVLGLLALFADLRVAAFPPLRPQEVTAGVELVAPGRSAAAGIVLSPGEPLTGETRLRTLLESGDSPVELAGPWLPVTGEWLLLGPEAFPRPLTVLRASGALTGVAEVEVRSAAGRLLARLDTQTPVLAVPRETDDPPASIVVRPRGPGRTIELPFGALPRIDLDPVTLPGFGAHRARVVGRPEPGGPQLLVEWRPEGGEQEPQAVRLGPDRPEAEISWVAASPFQPGVVWRVTRGDAPGPWSDPVPPAEGLVLSVPAAASPEPVVLDGLELRPDPADPSVWTYVPPGPFLELGPDGRPALGVVDAGPVSFLQITTRLDLPDAARNALAGRLPHPQRPPATVRAATVAVTRVAVETRPPDGAWASVAEGASSGVPPWTTALAATLGAEQSAAVKAALGGTRGRMRLVGELATGRENFVKERDVADLLGPT